MRTYNTPPKNEEELLLRCKTLEGLSFLQLANQLQITIPELASQRKGWIGQALEYALYATGGSQAIPDFQHLGIELKTIPLGMQSKPLESTFVTSIPLLTIHQQSWHSSQCRSKLHRVLWIPVEGERSIPFEQRRIGRASLWSPNEEEEATFAADWNELTRMICNGQLESIDASMGDYLQVRPKAMNARSLCYGFDSEGSKILTLPRGFYLRRSFTAKLF